MKMESLIGTGVAMVTPFNVKCEVDYSGIKKLVNHLISSNVEYLVVMGTTAESPVLKENEKRSILDCVLEENNKRLPVVYGIGGNDTKKIAAQVKTFEKAGVDAILSVSPYYNRPSQEGIFQHYKALNESSPLPFIVYNVPSRTGSNVSAETTLRIAENLDKAIMIKEASGNLPQVMEIIRNRPSEFLVVSGDDMLTLPITSCGGDGVISVIANAFPSEFSQMVREVLEGNLTEAGSIHYTLMPAIEMIFREGNPSGVKAFLEAMGICNSTVRLPNTSVSSKLNGEILDYLKRTDRNINA